MILTALGNMGYGTLVENAQPSKRIISLSPDITEILFAIGAGPELVAVSINSDYPPEAKHLPMVGGYQSINVEAIVALHPDLVVAWSGNPAADLAMIQKFGIPVYMVEDQSFNDIANTMKQLGRLANVESTANIAAHNFMQQYQRLLHQYAQAKPVKVFIEIDDAPLYTLSNKTLQGQVIHLCGGTNIFADLPSYAAEVSTESVITLDPDVIIVTSPITTQQWQKWHNMSAVKLHALYQINSDLFSRSGPRMIESAAIVCHYIDLLRKNSR